MTSTPLGAELPPEENSVMSTSQFDSVVITESTFVNDDGAADSRLRAAISEYVKSGLGKDSRALLRILVNARLLVPVVAVVDSQAGEVEKDSHMKSVELHGPNGDKALLAFTGVDSVIQWNSDARPIPQLAYLVAQAVIEQDLDAIVLDVSGPTPCAIEGQLLNLLAMGPNRESLMIQELEAVCTALGALPSLTSASWSLTNETIIITLQAAGFDEQLPQQLSDILNSSQLAVLLDYPFEVALSGQNT